MNILKSGGALALSLLLAACGGKPNAGQEAGPGAEAGASASQAGELHSAVGEVTAIAGDRVSISHGPIEETGWSAMAMTFRAAASEIVQGVSVGTRVSFVFRQDGGAYTLTSLKKGG